MPVSDTLIDTLFDGRYRIVRRLGAGGMANVYLAEDQELGRHVAIKILNERHANDEQFVERFRREAKSAAALSHPNIVSIYDRGEAEGTYYIAMEHLDGRTLKELIVARGPAPARIAIDYTKQILAAVRFAHRNGIVHRDIKPHNVLVDRDGRLKVTDFGIARAGASQMTEAGSIVGTAQYLSPEQARGGPVDQRSDLYSVGVVLYELLTGTVPFTGDSPVEIAMKHLSAKPEPPSTKRPDLPRDLDLIVMRAIAKDPDDRYQDAEEMQADLERVERGLGVTAQTAEAATAIIESASAMPTAITRPQATRPAAAAPPAYGPPPPVYYDIDEEPIRRRAIWPWLLVLLLLVGAIVAGVIAYDQIRDQLSASKPVAVPLLEGQRESLAVNQLIERKLPYEVERHTTTAEPVGFVYDQTPEPGGRIDRETQHVTIYVSLGTPTSLVPNVVGKSRDDAVAALTSRRLEPRVVEINSEKPVNTVTGQEPKAGAKIDQGSTVRINVSKGPKPIAVPSVEGQPFESANGTLQGAGFSVARQDVDSDQPRGIVVDQDPEANSLASRGATVTLSVSKGPKTVRVPFVESVDRDTALQTLRESGFKVRVDEQEVDDPALDNLVLAQDPAGDTEVKPGSTVTITVGKFVATESQPPPVEPPPPPAEPPPVEPPPPPPATPEVPVP
jgi:beta-lactam-binding protein with PASTA domain/tRNA A-37 threonylcarbamoyl transferase component Bud32